MSSSLIDLENSLSRKRRLQKNSPQSVVGVLRTLPKSRRGKRGLSSLEDIEDNKPRRMTMTVRDTGLQLDLPEEFRTSVSLSVEDWSSPFEQDSDPYRVEPFDPEVPSIVMSLPVSSETALAEETPGSFEVSYEEQPSVQESSVELDDETRAFAQDIQRIIESSQKSGPDLSQEERIESSPGGVGAMQSHQVFDEIGMALEHATTFDLGDIDLNTRFDAFEMALDSKDQALNERSSDQSQTLIAPEPVKLSEMEMVEDLSSIRSELARNVLPTAAPSPISTVEEDIPVATPAPVIPIADDKPVTEPSKLKKIDRTDELDPSHGEEDKKTKPSTEVDITEKTAEDTDEEQAVGKEDQNG